MASISLSPSDPVIPTKVTDRHWIHAFSPDEEISRDPINSYNDDENLDSTDGGTGNFSSEEIHTSGKWMLFLNNTHDCEIRGMTEHDYGWQCIKKMVERGGSSVHHAKCSTGWEEKEECIPGKSTGCICCYTVDYTNKRHVKKAADEIRQAFSYGTDMFYKTDQDTMAMKYRRLGSKFVSIYKHTVENQMYERDPIVKHQWNLIRF